VTSIAEPVRTRARLLRIGLLASWQARIGLAVTLLVLLLVVVGPFVAPYSPTAQLGIPYSKPGGGFLLGTDNLGRDVLSRLLYGGRKIVLLSVLATLGAYLIGTTLGLMAGYTRSRLDGVVMRGLDVVLSFPAILLLLVLASSLGAGVGTLLVGVIVVNVPGIARVIRSATLEVVGRAYVEAAVIRGESTRFILFREILPNISRSVVADAGPRFAGAFLIIAGLNYLGVGVNPPAADWGAMIFENRDGMTIQPWPVVMPAILIILLTISTNLLGDSVARSLGKSIDVGGMRR
jgi:peptide/nickel transport system permease protein